ncbi:MAG: DNA translocase FtsK [Clostridia bacterium]|nr:DNA translocase FtsK [Clostridia bacterium]
MALHNLKRSLFVTNLTGFLFNGGVAGLIHLIVSSAKDTTWSEQFKATASTAWQIGQGTFDFSGGIMGAVFGGGPLFACGKGGAFVIVIALVLVSLFFHIGIETNSLGDSVSGAINEGKNKLDESAENMKIKNAERQRLRAERLEAARLRREEEEKQKQAESFDFNSTEIDLDPENMTDRETGVPLRQMRRYYPEDKVFNFGDSSQTAESGSGVKLSSYDFISDGSAANKPHMPTKRTPVEDKLASLISDVNSQAKAPVQQAKPTEPQKSEADDFNDEDDIIKKAVHDADESLKKNKTEVENYKQEKKKKDYILPPIDCLNQPEFSSSEGFANEMQITSKKLVDVLASFGVETKLVGISRGPSVTRYELSPAPGVKISKITNLADDIALGLASSGVRIEAPIPNKSAVGIEVPNKSRSTVTLREIISSAEYKKHAGKLLTVALGKDITGNVNCTDLSKMPHLLIAGTTGSGKSVCLNCMITSILYNATPSQVKLLMIDPKQVEFTVYNGIPHLLVPVITDARKAAGSLAWAVSEMDNRYKAFSNCGVRDIGGFNKYVQSHPEIEPMPQIVIFIDELNDLMMVSPKEVEDSICRLAQKARAAGMHLVVATQRPSVDVITGVIKANIPSRLSLSVSSQVDSRTILDCIGAENLLGNGDMLFSPVGITKPVRIQGAYLSDEEIERIVNFIKSQENAEYDDGIMSEIERNATADNSSKKKGSAASAADEGGNYDALIDDAMDLVTLGDIASTTAIQRKLGVGYARAGRIMDQLEELGFVGAADGNKPRKVLVSRAQYLEMKASGSSQDEGVPEEYDIFSD